MAYQQETLTLAPVPLIEALDWFERIRDNHAHGIAAMVRAGIASVWGLFDDRDIRGVVAVSVNSGWLEVNALAGDRLGAALVPLAQGLLFTAAQSNLVGLKIYTTRRGLVRRLSRIGAQFELESQGRWVGKMKVKNV